MASQTICCFIYVKIRLAGTQNPVKYYNPWRITMVYVHLFEGGECSSFITG